jgi:hypothetical protein
MINLAGKYLQTMLPIPTPLDPRDFLMEPNLWASQLLPLGVSIDQAIKDGVWPKKP